MDIGRLGGQGPQSTAHAALQQHVFFSGRTGKRQQKNVQCRARRTKRMRAKAQKVQKASIPSIAPTPHGQALADALARYDGICMPD